MEAEVGGGPGYGGTGGRLSRAKAHGLLGLSGCRGGDYCVVIVYWVRSELEGTHGSFLVIDGIWNCPVGMRVGGYERSGASGWLEEEVAESLLPKLSLEVWQFGGLAVWQVVYVPS